MPDDSGAGEKTEEATPRKRQQAREEGQVAFSSEVNTAGILLIGFCLLALLGPTLWATLRDLTRFAVSDGIAWNADASQIFPVLFARLTPVGTWMLGFMGLLFLGGLGMSIAQVGLKLAPKALQPKFQRLNPLTGLQRLFGLRGVMRLVFSVLKMAVVVGLGYYLISHALVDINIYDIDLHTRFGDLAWTLFLIAIKMAICLAIIASFDFAYQRFQHNKELKMSKQEVKEEFKQSEGDPMVKSKIRQIQRQMAQSRMMQEVPQADVVITNPTHVAVALKYDVERMEAPQVVAKGYDLIAQRIKEIAAEHGVPMVENITLARALAKEVELGRNIPVKWYQAVAEILSRIYRMQRGG